MPSDIRERGKQGAIAPAAPELSEPFEREIDLYALMLRILERIHYVLLAAIVGGLMMGIYASFFVEPKYTSSAKIYVLSSSDSALNLSDLQIGTYLTSDYREVFSIWEVHEQVIRNLDLPYTYRQLDRMTAISNPSNSRILVISVTSTSPEEAADIANEYAQVASDYIAEKMATDRPNTLSIALPGSSPISPNITHSIMVGTLLGILLSVGFLAVQFLVDDRIKSAEDISKYTGMAVLAMVPLQREKSLPHIPTQKGLRDPSTDRRRT